MHVVTHHDHGVTTTRNDHIAIEAPLEIRIADIPLAVTMRTPGQSSHDLELAAGFCLTEGIIRDPDDLETVQYCDVAAHGNIVTVTLSDDVMTNRATSIDRARRELYLSSSCGLCGKQSIDRIEQNLTRPIIANFTVTQSTLLRLPATMHAAQPTFTQTGGLHAAALFTAAGKLIVLREDIGRHNAVDKVIGHQLLLGNIPIDPAVLLVSGRASFEIMQKAALAGIGIVAAISAPSSLAVDFAQRLNMTLIGFLRPSRMNIYHDYNRIT